MSKKNKKKKAGAANKPVNAKPEALYDSPKKEVSRDSSIDSIIEETRFLSEKEKMEKAAKKLSGGPKMEEIYSNKSKEVRLTNQSPLDAVPDEDAPEEITDAKNINSENKEDVKSEPDTIVTLTTEFEENATISDEIIDNVDSFNVRSIKLRDMDSIDISLDDDDEDAPEKEESAEEEMSVYEKTFAKSPAQAMEENEPEEEASTDGISDFERLFGKPKPVVSAAQTVVSKVPVYQHESKVEKVYAKAGRFSAIVETEYKKYSSPANTASSRITITEDAASDENDVKPTAKETVRGIAGRIVGFFSSSDENENVDFKEQTMQIEDYRSYTDAKSIATEINLNQRKTLVNSTFTGVLGLIALIMTILSRILSDLLSKNMGVALAFAIANLLLVGISAWVCRVTISNGLTPLKRFKGNSDTGAAVAALAGILQAVMALIIPTDVFGKDQFLYTTLVILTLFLNSLGKFYMVRRVRENFRFATAKSPVYSAKIYNNEDIARQLTSGTPQGKPIVAYQHKTDFLSDFLRLSYSPDPCEDMSGKIAPAALIVSIAIAVFYGVVSRDVFGAFSVLALMTCLCTPVSNLLSVNLPMQQLCQDTLSKNAMISGYPSVRQFCDTKAVICEAKDLYPVDSITLNGVKAFTNHRVEETILAAAAILKEAKNPMECVFDHVVQSHKGKLPKVESVLYEDKLGLVGWVDGERILIGSRALLDKYAIKAPSEEFENGYKIEGRCVTYLVRSGELTAMFVTTYATTLRIAQLLQKAEANGISLLVHTTDCNITGEKIAEDFGIYFRSVKVLSTGLGNVCQEITSVTEDSSRSYLATRGSFMSLLRAITGCVRMKSNISLAIIIQLIGVIFGVLVVASIALFAGVSAVGNLEVLAFAAFWAAASVAAPLLQKP